MDSPPCPSQSPALVSLAFCFFFLAKCPHLLWQLCGKPWPARAFAWIVGWESAATPRSAHAPGAKQLPGYHCWDLGGARSRRVGVLVWGQPWRSPFPLVPSCCQWGELEAEPHWACLLPKVHRTNSCQGKRAWKSGGLHAAVAGEGGASVFPRGASGAVSVGLLPRPLGHAVPLTFVPQRLDSEALEWEEVACGVKLGTAERLEGVGAG